MRSMLHYKCLLYNHQTYVEGSKQLKSILRAKGNEKDQSIAREPTFSSQFEATQSNEESVICHH